ncbi:MAG: hypothetical protein AB1426_11555 [Bacillota bacterium]
MKVVVDTNIIDHLRGAPQAAKVLKGAEDGSLEGLISTITIMEIMVLTG